MNTLQRGVSMIEICVVLVIVAILFGMAAPSFSAWIGNVQIRTASESIQNGLQLARAEAIRRNASTTFWLTSAAVPPTADWLVGCAAPAISGAGAQPEAPGDCPGILTIVGLPADGPPYNWIQRQSAAAQQTSLPQVSTPNNGIAVTFNSLGMVILNPDGTPTVTQIDVQEPALGANQRPLRVTIGGGQVRMCDPALALASDPRGCL